MHIYNIDLHYHAGQERGEGLGLVDYLEHAQVTGRRLVGLTDHIGKYFPDKAPDTPTVYPASPEGLRVYREEVDKLQPQFPDIRLLFCPELGASFVTKTLPDHVIAMSDYFICESRFPGDMVSENTDALIQTLQDASQLTAKTGRPTYVAHPFRSAVNYRLVKRPIEPWVTDLEPRSSGSGFSADAVNGFFLLDVAAIGEAARDLGVPLEVNGNTWERVRAINLVPPLQLLEEAYRILHRVGAPLVPGSDQHGFLKKIGRTGGYVPADVFATLGITADDITFIQPFLT